MIPTATLPSPGKKREKGVSQVEGVDDDNSLHQHEYYSDFSLWEWYHCIPEMT
jgi:hypothetical protein